MLIWSVAIYLLASIGIGLFVATRVHNSRDFAVAGRSLPLPVVTATVFATWFGAEAIFGVSATFVKDGLRGVVADRSLPPWESASRAIPPSPQHCTIARPARGRTRQGHDCARHTI